MYFQGCTTPMLKQSRVLTTHRLAVVYDCEYHFRINYRDILKQGPHRDCCE